VNLIACHGQGGNQKWIYDDDVSFKSGKVFDGKKVSNFGKYICMTLYRLGSYVMPFITCVLLWIQENR